MKMPTSNAVIWIFVVSFVVCLIAAMLVPAYTGYGPRAKLSEAILATSNCRTVIPERMKQSSPLAGAGKWGCESSESADRVSKFVISIKTNGMGEIEVVVTGINGATEGMALVMVPRRNRPGNDAVAAGSAFPEWDCGPAPGNARDIVKYLPATCRSTIKTAGGFM